MEATERAKTVEIQMCDTMMELTELRLQIESLQEQLEARNMEIDRLRGEGA